MNLDDARELWQSDDGSGGARGPDAATIALVRDQSRALDRTVRRRDLREIVACVVVAAFFAPVLLHPVWLSRAGAAVVIGACVLIAVKLRRARRAHPEPPADASIVALLTAERARVEAQARLLGSVLWWYILPLVLGIALAFAGMRGWGWLTLGYTAAVVTLSWGIHYLNRRAVQDHFEPRREELDRLLRQIREETDNA